MGMAIQEIKIPLKYSFNAVLVNIAYNLKIHEFKVPSTYPQSSSHKI